MISLLYLSLYFRTQGIRQGKILLRVYYAWAAFAYVRTFGSDVYRLCYACAQVKKLITLSSVT